MQLPLHAETRRYCSLELLAYVIRVKGKLIKVPFNSHEKLLVFSINMLIQVEDIATVIKDEIGNGNNDAWLILAVD
jgi:hypothetical protein